MMTMDDVNAFTIRHRQHQTLILPKIEINERVFKVFVIITSETSVKAVIMEQGKISSAIAASGKFLLESIGDSAVRAVFLTSPMLMSLLAAGALRIGKLSSDDDRDSSKDDAPVKATDSMYVERKQGTTIIHIENLTINLTAEVVQQLNMNPEEVVNQLTEQIQQTSLKALAEK